MLISVGDGDSVAITLGTIHGTTLGITVLGDGDGAGLGITVLGDSTILGTILAGAGTDHIIMEAGTAEVGMDTTITTIIIPVRLIIVEQAVREVHIMDRDIHLTDVTTVEEEVLL